MARLRIIKTLNGHRGSGIASSANDLLKSDPINGSIGIPSHFQETLDQLEYLYQGLRFIMELKDWERKRNGN